MRASAISANRTRPHGGLLPYTDISSHRSFHLRGKKSRPNVSWGGSKVLQLQVLSGHTRNEVPPLVSAATHGAFSVISQHCSVALYALLLK